MSFTTSISLKSQTSLSQAFQLLKVANGQFGQYITDNSGISLYLFMKDNQSASTCYEDCAVVWGPLLQARLGNVVGTGVDRSLVGTSQRTGGTVQVTYNKWPLYYYILDSQSGDTLGEGINGSGGLWYLISPSGEPILPSGSGSPTNSTVPTTVVAPTDNSTNLPTDNSSLPAANATIPIADNSTIQPVANSISPPADNSTSLPVDDSTSLPMGNPANTNSSSLIADNQQEHDQLETAHNATLPPSGTPEVMTSNITLQYLTDWRGMSLYIFDNDVNGESSCNGLCSIVWPPLIVAPENSADFAAGLNQSLISNFTRADGQVQFVYNEKPLYYFNNDKKAGDYLGYGLYSNEAYWWLVDPSGMPVVIKTVMNQGSNAVQPDDSSANMTAGNMTTSDNGNMTETIPTSPQAMRRL